MKVTIDVVAGDLPPTGAQMTSMVQAASDPTTSPQLLRQIATQTDWQLRQLVASNPNTPTDTLWQLGIDFPEAILNNPVFELLQLEQLDLVATIPHPTLTSLLQCDRVPTRFMEYAVSRQDYSLWLAVAYNPHTPSAILENLAQKSRRQDRELIRAVAAHPQTPVHLLAEIVDIGEGIARIVAENAQTPISVLKQILRKYAHPHDPTFTTLVALHPQLNPCLLMQMYLAPSDAAAQSLWLAKQIDTPPAQLMQLADTDWSVLRLAVVRHPHTPSQTIDLLWQQLQLQIDPHAPSVLDRLIYDSFASNPQTSPQLRGELRKLLK
ncbi:hypothetical protein [Chamaesiphon sp. OTE_75_metabat_556]|uniref:variant leucine-rich repeat-containing protein n=1 Tax=Chamaesiphon sp. OTE_75_metabat_556 TaxID=2964692 RepID=UPI00286D2FD3|nr:hypothetical protein [Chamaesiphon sp. OTE_75_metabat_556]